MKKMILSLVAAIVSATATYAQSSLVATLTHNGTTTAYYGATALVQAHEAAADGDIITLSSGTFNPTNITKGITLRGAGATVDLDNHIEPTIISGSFRIGSESVTTAGLIIEGIYNDNTITYAGRLEYALFIKSRFSRFGAYNSFALLYDCTFVNCIIAEGIDVPYNETVVTLTNCVYFNDYGSPKNMNFTNSVITNAESFASSSFRNCILLYTTILDNSNSAYRCISDDEYVFEYIPNTTNYVASMDDLFLNNNIDNVWNDLYNFELKDEAKTTYLGTDGTQIGIYGGSLPFNLTPTNPQITRFDMNSSVENGKLTVKINVQ